MEPRKLGEEWEKWEKWEEPLPLLPPLHIVALARARA